MTTFNLDEYVGLGPEHPQSYACFMREHFFSKVNIAPERIHIPDGLARDIPAHCEAYEAAIREAGGIDLQLLGIGSDGHIGFNEPSSSLGSRTRLKTLTERTIRDNARFFPSPEEVPRHVITMGVGTIFDARRCMVLAFGEKKAAAVAGMVEGPVTAEVPASALQFHASLHAAGGRGGRRAIEAGRLLPLGLRKQAPVAAPMILAGAHLILPDRILRAGHLRIEEGRDRGGLRQRRSRRGRARRCVDLDGLYVAPGFIDLHIHGALGRDAMEANAEAFETICRHHAAGGTTSLCLTTIAAPLDRLLAVIEAAREYRRAAAAPACWASISRGHIFPRKNEERTSPR